MVPAMLVVQKFGGTSVADPDRIRQCARRAVEAYLGGNGVAVVVSAMGSTTDQLLDLAGRVSTSAPRRELDLLLASGEQASAALMAMAINDLGVDAVALAGGGIGIRTDGSHCNAKIRSIDARAMRHFIDEGRIVVAAGFQGTAPDGSVTTLGRGGSDTTAVAIAAALGVRDGEGVCEIFTDVEGVYTADPRVVPAARKIECLSYEEMVELASLGAGVLQTRAGLFAQRYEVPLHVRHSQHPEPGTMVVRESTQMERVAVVGCALTSDLGRIAVRRLPNRPGVQAAIFARIAAADVLVDDIIQNEAGATADVSFTVEASRLADIKLAVQDALPEIGAGEAEVTVEVGLAKVSVVGVGMRTHTGVAATMFKALAAAGINIANITTSEIKISCLVSQDLGARAMQAVHEAFGLDRDAAAAAPAAEVAEH